MKEIEHKSGREKLKIITVWINQKVQKK